MAVYGYSEQQIEKMVGDAKRRRIRLRVSAIFILVLSALVYFYRPSFKTLPEGVWGALLGLLITSFLPRNRGWIERLRQSLGQSGVQVSPSAVIWSGAKGHKRQVSIAEIVRAEEPSFGTGLCLRTSNRYRWFLIPRKLEGYAAIKGELLSSGVTVVKTAIPPNWEEFAGVLLFIGTMVCAVYVHDVRVLKVNLLAALLLSLGMLFVISSNPEALALPRMRWARFGAFLPVVFAAGGLWFALHP
jgi:hypothetical protein